MFRAVFLCSALAATFAAAATDRVATTEAGAHATAAARPQSGTRKDASRSVPRGEAPTSSESHPARDARQHVDAAKDDGKPTGDMKLSGMSILGNQDAPKSLVIVPWKSATIGRMPGLSMLLDDSVRPVDKDVFMRELAYYRIRTGAK